MKLAGRKIAVLSGDGIGPEVMTAALAVLSRVQACMPKLPDIELEEYPVGGAAIDQCGRALPLETLKGCEQADAILFGSIGGPKWEHLPESKQPERAALLPLRKHFQLFANLRPIRTFPELSHHVPVRLKKEGVDILIVRELTGGIYFATPKGDGGKGDQQFAFDTMRYHRFEVERIARLAFLSASQREKKTVHSIDKANVLHSMAFWRKIVSKLYTAENYTEKISLEHMYVDNAAMQLILNPAQFDVVLCPNLFGDILSDEASVLCGSLGLLPSASLSAHVATPTSSAGSSSGSGSGSGSGSAPTESRFGLYEPAGGSAPTIAGKDVANPIAQILSLALLLRFSFQCEQAAAKIESAVEKGIADGLVTQDIATKKENDKDKKNDKQSAIGCREMGEEICRRIS